MPLLSVKVLGNWLFASVLYLMRLRKVADFCNSPAVAFGFVFVLTGLGFTTPTGYCNLSRTILIGSAKSESLEMTTACSYSSSYPSIMRYVARLTSVPFSSVFLT